MEPRKTTPTDRPPDLGDGWTPWDDPPPPRSRRLDLSALFVLVDAIRRAVPADIERQFTALIREALLTLRSLIDWYLERLEREQREPEVEEIPIE